MVAAVLSLCSVAFPLAQLLDLLAHHSSKDPRRIVQALLVIMLLVAARHAYRHSVKMLMLVYINETPIPKINTRNAAAMMGSWCSIHVSPNE